MTSTTTHKLQQDAKGLDGNPSHCLLFAEEQVQERACTPGLAQLRQQLQAQQAGKAQLLGTWLLRMAC